MTQQNSIWPNFYIVGAAKCGTTSLYDHLKKHPQVFLPEMKEPNFFAAAPRPDEILLKVSRCATQAEYQQLYEPSEGCRAIGDASISYLWDAGAPRRIHEICPGAKIIIMLRDPVARAHSHYLDNLLHGIESAPSMQEALRQDSALIKSSWFASAHYIEVGLYHAQVRRYLETFGSDQVLVLLFDDLVRDPKKLYSSITSHIGVDPAPLESVDLSEARNYYRMPKFKTAYRIAGALGLRTKLLTPAMRRWLNQNPLLFDRKKPPLDEQSRRFLQETYGPDIDLLEGLLQRKMPELRKSWI